MAQFTLDINDEMCERVFAAFADRFEYQLNKTDDETMQDFTRRMVINYIRFVVVQSEQEKAANAAKVAVAQTLETGLQIS